ncbi:hypothetical protein Salat_0879500 [Sesamum alatum]|uniref:Uncharacterized protein n=1 Tax=Sesamum alatum TaxID=300844 RepID=A0AAE1YJ08_9LAMI|nr:hypothetical protein Salat_0879500 [Sesamum alatum]
MILRTRGRGLVISSETRMRREAPPQNSVSIHINIAKGPDLITDEFRNGVSHLVQRKIMYMDIKIAPIHMSVHRVFIGRNSLEHYEILVEGPRASLDDPLIINHMKKFEENRC